MGSEMCIRDRSIADRRETGSFDVTDIASCEMTPNNGSRILDKYAQNRSF